MRCCTCTQRWSACWAVSCAAWTSRLLAATGTPAAIAALGPARVKRAIAVASPRDRGPAGREILTAISEQTVLIPATEQYGQVIRGLASQLHSVLAQREALTAQLEELLATHPLAEILTSMPGVGPRTAIELLRTVGAGSTFASAAHVASDAGLAPATRQSGPQHQGVQQARRGNRSRAGRLHTSPLPSLRHPASREIPHELQPKAAPTPRR